MAENSKIEWTDHTWNPWRGCTKVSPGCQNCYAEALSKRTGHGEYKRGIPRERLSEANWKKPIKWNEEKWFCENCGFVRLHPGQLPAYSERSTCPQCFKSLIERRPRVFCASLADWLDDEVPIEWMADLLKLIHDTPNLDWQLLTKRPENWFGRIQAARNFLTKGGCAETSIWLNDWLPTPATSGVYERGRQATAGHDGIPGVPPENVWIGVTCEDQKRADERIPELLKIPAKVRFLSVEPMLEKIDISIGLPWKPEIAAASVRSPILKAQLLRKTEIPGINWCIVGGESGPKRREFNSDWARNLREDCKASGVAYFFKQVDKVQPIPEDLMIREFPV